MIIDYGDKICIHGYALEGEIYLIDFVSATVFLLSLKICPACEYARGVVLFLCDAYV